MGLEMSSFFLPSPREFSFRFGFGSVRFGLVRLGCPMESRWTRRHAQAQKGAAPGAAAAAAAAGGTKQVDMSLWQIRLFVESVGADH